MLLRYSFLFQLAYAFATMPTTEGTVKKCVLRLIGTFVGAFSAWAAIRATGDNDIGLVAWITITTFLSVYLSLEKSEKARLGQSKDYGYAGFYIILTQSVIVFDYVGGVGDGDDLVVDRIVSNVTGVLMASFLAVIPPRVMGGNPKWALLVAKKTKDGLRECAFCLLDDAAKEAADLDKMKSTYVREVNELRSDALYLLEDAKRMSFFPFFCVDTSLEEEIYSLAITSSAVATLYDQVSEAIHDPRYSQQSEEEESDLRRRVTQLVSGSVPEEVRISLDRKQVKNVADPVEALVEAMETINERIMLHQRKLGSSPAESKS